MIPDARALGKAEHASQLRAQRRRGRLPVASGFEGTPLG